MAEALGGWRLSLPEALLGLGQRRLSDSIAARLSPLGRALAESVRHRPDCLGEALGVWRALCSCWIHCPFNLGITFLLIVSISGKLVHNIPQNSSWSSLHHGHGLRGGLLPAQSSPLLGSCPRGPTAPLPAHPPRLLPASSLPLTTWACPLSHPLCTGASRAGARPSRAVRPDCKGALWGRTVPSLFQGTWRSWQECWQALAG